MLESFPEKSSPACGGMDDSTMPADRRPMSPTTTREPTQRRASFLRRNSMEAPLDEGCDAYCFGATERIGSKQQNDNATTELPRFSGCGSKSEKALARICGTSRSKCGYCGGRRMHVLSVLDAYNRVVVCHSAKEHSGDEEYSEAVKKSEHVDESRTSKSYGLLFDRIPCVTYEGLISRGWRRSGKHLYRPHNFESCCPAISIRLDVLKFNRSQSDVCTAQVEKDGGDLARTVLIRGSKSQRKVGKTILRELQSYNNTCIHDIAGSKAKSFNSHVEDTQLEHISAFSADQDKARFESQAKRQHKKSRNLSPDRDHDETDDNLNTNPPTATPDLSAFRNSLQAHKFDQVMLHPLIERLSRTVYDVVTHEARKSMATAQNQTCRDGEKVERPAWAWWNDDVHDEDISIPKWCSFKVLLPSGNSIGQACASTKGIPILVSTSACAAASGRSASGGPRKDVDKTLDKTLLAHSVVDSLKRFILNIPSAHNHLDGYTLNLQVMDVSCHEESGHVHVSLYGTPTAVLGSNDHIQSASEISPIKSEKGLDPISEFLSRHEANAHKLRGAIYTQEKKPPRQRFLTVRSVPANVSSLQPEVHQLFCRYQTAVHGDLDPFFGVIESTNTIDDLSDYDSYRQTNPLGFLDIETAYSHLDEIRRTKIKLSYLAFYRFLGETPVVQDFKKSPENLLNEDGYDIHVPFGTYHQQYRLSTSKNAFDGPLIAVGVADILPHCFSSVYSFYDPTLSCTFKLGKYTALREIEWVRRASKYRPDLHYYYLGEKREPYYYFCLAAQVLTKVKGYYIHSCGKMTYKADYKPSELLCPVNLSWVDFEVGKKRLDDFSPIRHCCALSDCQGPKKFEQSKLRIEEVTLDIGEKEPHLVQVGMLDKEGREIVDPYVTEFVSEVGAEISHAFIIKLR